MPRTSFTCGEPTEAATFGSPGRAHYAPVNQGSAVRSPSTAAAGRAVRFGVLCLLLAGCGGGVPTPTPAPPAATAAPATAAPATAAPANPTPAASPGSSAMPLHVGCDDTPCKLTAGTWVLEGEYSFILGMEFTVPDGWESREQDAGEFNLFPLAHPDDHFSMAKDIAAVKTDGSLAIVPEVPRTAEGIEAYWRSDPNLVVSPSEPATIGDGIPATTFVLTVSQDAKFIDPDCPALRGLLHRPTVLGWRRRWRRGPGGCARLLRDDPEREPDAPAGHPPGGIRRGGTRGPDPGGDPDHREPSLPRELPDLVAARVE